MAEHHPVGYERERESADREATHPADARPKSDTDSPADSGGNAVAERVDADVSSIGVVGLGYVGLPLALAIREAGFDVTGVDVDRSVIERLDAGESTVTDVSDEEVASTLDDEHVEFTGEYDHLSAVDAVSICVPTPLRKTNTPDLSYVTTAVERLATVVSPGCTVVLESTVYPGATAEVVARPFESAGFEVGEDVYLAFSPERIDPGNETFGPTDIPKVVGGLTPACGDRAAAMYGQIFDEVVLVDTAKEAEFVKLLENTFRSVNIGLVNELAQIAHELDVDIWNVIDAAESKPFGFMPFYPGPGLGGHCIPIDPVYLSWKAGEHGIDTRFITLAETVNREMPDHIVRRVIDQLDRRDITIGDASVLVVGAAYKPDVSDTRESPAIQVIAALEEWNAAVDYHDPHVPALTVGERTYESIPLTPERLQHIDCVIVVTDHSDVDLDGIVDHVDVVFDSRNATAETSQDNPQNLVRL